VQFTAQQKELIATLVESGDVAGAQAVILGELETQFGGAAAAAANADPYTQLANEIGNLAEEFGGIINDALKPLLGFIREVVDEVKGWSDETKTLAVVIGGLLAALGPTLIAVGSMINALVTIKGALKLATIEQLKLNAAALANPYLLAAAAITALGVSIYAFNKRSTDAKEKVDDLKKSVEGLTSAEAAYEAQKAVTEQAEKVRKLREAYEALADKRAIGDQQDQRIFNTQKQQAKDVLANAEKELEGYRKILEQKKSDAYWSGVASERLAELNENRKASNETIVDEGQALASTEEPAKTYVDTLNERLAAIDAEYKVTGDLTVRVDAIAEAYKTAAIAAQLLGNETEALALKQEMLNRAVAPEVLTPINPNADTGPVTNTGGPIVSNATTEAINAQIEALTGLGTAYDNAQQKGLNFAAAIEDAIEQAAESIVFNLAAMAGAALSSGDGMQGAGRMIIATLADLAIQVGQIAIGVGITIDGIQKALVNLNPYVALAAGIALVALGSFAKSELAKAARSQSTGGSGPSLGVPAFAQGGLVTGPMLAMVGDNPSGKEAIIPFERMGEFMKMMGGGQSTQQVVVTGRISGRDLILSNERTIYDRTRTKG
jgi:hypothetical protein